MIHIITNSYQNIGDLLATDRFIEMDVGCGRGGFTLQLAEKYPERSIVGTDVMLGRLRKIQKKVEKRGFVNVDLLRASHVELVGFQLPDNSVDRVHYLCPDPWPKARHRAKRVASTDFFVRIARVLKPGGILHIATDHPPYLELIHKSMAQLPWFERDDELISDLAGMQTDFEKQWLAEGKSVPHFGYRVKK